MHPNHCSARLLLMWTSKIHKKKAAIKHRPPEPPHHDQALEGPTVGCN